LPRFLLLFVALWAVLLAPTLCTAGVLVHACECEDEAVCDHESDCDTDPCPELMLRRDDTHEELFVDSSFGLLSQEHVLPALPLSIDLEFAAMARHVPLGRPHASDLPLLN